MESVFIIAEAGVNHNGSLENAKRLVVAAAKAGADAVKFQTFKAEKLVSNSTPKAEYQKETTPSSESHYEMIKKLELDWSSHQQLKDFCGSQGIQFLSSPFDLDSIDLLNNLKLEIFKIPSGEITNVPYLRKIGGLRKKVILSTGMANLGEIEFALDTLTQSGNLLEHIAILHCNSEYPTPMKDVNLKAMTTLASAFPEIDIGYSDHTLGFEISIAAVALGASIIEKHFTLDKTSEGPDHRTSLIPEELTEMVQAIRNIEKAMGDGRKKISPSEIKNIPIARKSITAARKIFQGELLTEDNLTVKRPGTGISPTQWDYIIGKKSPRNFSKDELIEL